MSDIYTVKSLRNENVFIHVIPGHFISSSNHMNYYIGTSDVKHNHDISVDAAALLAEYYNAHDIEVDTVLCLYETQSLGAYLADELSRPDMLDPNPISSIFTVGSEYDAAGNLIFRDNLRHMIKDKNVVILISCITSGRTVEKAIESVAYYSGKVVGVSSVFSARSEIGGITVNTIFSQDDIPGYASYPSQSCPLCRDGVQVDAISNGYGYSKFQA